MINYRSKELKGLCKEFNKLSKELLRCLNKLSKSIQLNEASNKKTCTLAEEFSKLCDLKLKAFHNIQIMQGRNK